MAILKNENQVSSPVLKSRRLKLHMAEGRKVDNLKQSKTT